MITGELSTIKRLHHRLQHKEIQKDIGRNESNGGRSDGSACNLCSSHEDADSGVWIEIPHFNPITTKQTPKTQPEQDREINEMKKRRRKR
jgi:hypothetical protein